MSLPVKPANIPQRLKDYPHWIVWKEAERTNKNTGEVYSTKIPCNPATGRRCDATSKDSGTSFGEAYNGYSGSKKLAGVGILLFADSPIMGVDEDNCVAEDGTIKRDVETRRRMLDSYTEYSPSGTGLRTILIAEKPGDRCRTGKIEMYDQDRFLTITGHRLHDAPATVNERQDELEQVYQLLFGSDSKEKQKHPPRPSTPHDLEDRELIEKAREATNGDKFRRLWQGDTNGYTSHSEADLALCSLLGFWTQGDSYRVDQLFRQSGLMREKWRRDDYRERTLNKALERQDFYNPRQNGSAKTSGATPDTFWPLGEVKKVKLNRGQLLRFWKQEGFRKTYLNDPLDSELVRVQDQQVSRVSPERIKDHTLAYVRSLSDDYAPEGKTMEAVEAALMRGANVYFAENLLEFLPELEGEFKRDNQDEAFFYFQNGFVRARAGDLEVRPYSNLDGLIWRDQVIDRTFKKLPLDELHGCEWQQFTQNVCGGDKTRHAALCSALGYLLHGFKDPALTKAVIFVDEAVSDVPEGRSGKSIVSESVRKLVPGHREDARNFSFDRNFAFQSVRRDQRIFDFNDAGKGFDFERLFSAITDGVTVERKGATPFTIGFKDAPKFVISTNYIIEGEGGSFEDRVFQIELAQHYTKSHRPVDEFGKRFFDDWNQEEWTRFYNFMLQCVSRFLENGLTTYQHVNLQFRKLRQETNPDFADWILNKKAGRYKKSALHRSFKDDYADDYDGLTQRLFTRWCNTYGRVYTGEILPSSHSGDIKYIHLPELEVEKT